MQRNACDVHYCADDRHPFPLVPAIVHGRIGDVAGYLRSERIDDGYRYYYNSSRLPMNLPPVWFDLSPGLADSAAAVPDLTVIRTTGSSPG